jgi:hypothetical protein
MDVPGTALPEGRGWRATRNALYLKAGLGYDDWLRVGHNVTVVTNSAAWWLGDWLNFGRESYGQRYEIAVSTTEFEHQTLRNYAWVASRFPVSRRRDMLSFGHHAELAALAEGDQEAWLDRCAAERWPRSELRRHRRLARQDGTAVGQRATEAAERASIALPVQTERRHRWEAAADATGMPLLAWIEAALDIAATDTLQNHLEYTVARAHSETASASLSSTSVA